MGRWLVVWVGGWLVATLAINVVRVIRLISLVSTFCVCCCLHLLCVTDQRLDRRVDQMLERGLIVELDSFNSQCQSLHNSGM